MKPAESSDRPTTQDAAVAWLMLDGNALPPVTAGLDRGQCLALAAALLAAAVGRDHPSGLAPGLAERLAVVAGRVSPLAAWLASLPKQSPASSGGMSTSLLHDDVQLLSWLAVAIIVPDEGRSPPLDDRATPLAEAAMLRETVRAALAHAELRGQFDRAVAEARLEAMRELAYALGMKSTIRSPTLPRGHSRSCWRRATPNAAAGSPRSWTSRFGLAI